MLAFTPAAASADVCGLAGWVDGLVGKACTVVSHGDQLIQAGKKIVTGHPGAAVKTILGGGGSSSGPSSGSTTKTAAVALAAIVTWTVVGAKFALHETADAISKTTSPQLTTTWFSSTYWRIAGISALLTMPFLFATAVQALIRSDMSLLARATFGYLPLSLIGVGIAAPLTMLLLAASDQMSAVVSAAAGDAGGRFLGQVGLDFGILGLIARAPFWVFLVAMLTAFAALTLWIEMLMREAAVYVVVLMLPLAFAAMVWPARRVWAVRTVELLVALILSKFVIVAVLSLGGAALGQTGSNVAGMLTGLVLVLLAACAPWALLRLIPLAELAGSVAGQVSGEFRGLNRSRRSADEGAERGSNWAASVLRGLRDQTGTAGADAAADPATVHAPAVPIAERAAQTSADLGRRNGASADANSGGGSAEPERTNGTTVSATASHSGPGAPSPSATSAAPQVDASAASQSGTSAAAETVTGSADPVSRSRQPHREPIDPRWLAEDSSWSPVVLGPEGLSAEFGPPPENDAAEASSLEAQSGHDPGLGPNREDLW
jgi:hypothetical protein